MPAFGNASKQRLSTCHPSLIRLAEKVVAHYDCAVVDGHRDQKTQQEYYQTGKSKNPWPLSKHNLSPSQALDLAPWVTLKDGKKGIPWQDATQFKHFAGFVLGVAAALGIAIRWGGDWDSDRDLKDQTFNDLAHFELWSSSSIEKLESTIHQGDSHGSI